MKKTCWFDAVKINPVRTGWYETSLRYCGSVGLRLYWNGRHWTRHDATDLETAFPWNGDKWRGLTKEAA